MKRGLIIGGGIVAVIIIAVAVIFFVVLGNIDGIVKNGVETYGSEITQASVTLDEVEISTSGTGKLGGLTIGNPPGFQDRQRVPAWRGERQSRCRLGNRRYRSDPRDRHRQTPGHV